MIEITLNGLKLSFSVKWNGALKMEIKLNYTEITYNFVYTQVCALEEYLLL